MLPLVNDIKWPFRYAKVSYLFWILYDGTIESITYDSTSFPAQILSLGYSIKKNDSKSCQPRQYDN